MPHLSPLVSVFFIALAAMASPGCNSASSAPDNSATAPTARLNSSAINTSANTTNTGTNTLDFTRPQVFYFTNTPTADGHRVTTGQPYSDSIGFGFDLQTQPTAEHQPFYFSVKVPEGNYRVSLEFGHAGMPSNNTLRAELRRLYVKDLKTRAGEFITKDILVNVRNNSLQTPEQNAPGINKVSLKTLEQHRLHWDNKLTLEFNGTAPQVQRVTIQKVDVPTLYLVGDSTVTDQPYEPAASWGQMLPYFFTAPLFSGDIAVANHAESGETMKSFIMEGRFAKVLERMKPGDYLLIQFGHNDQKKQWPQTYVEAMTTYKEYLRVFIAEARLRGATPVLITSMQRRTFDQQGKIVNSHGQYPQAVREIAQEKNVALIDLDKMSVQLYETLGTDKAPLAFNDGGKDATHHNNYGAYQLAQAVVTGLRQSRVALARHFADSSSYNPSRPDPVESFVLAPSPAFSSARPDGN